MWCRTYLATLGVELVALVANVALLAGWLLTTSETVIGSLLDSGSAKGQGSEGGDYDDRDLHDDGIENSKEGWNRYRGLVVCESGGGEMVGNS